ncbi:MAG: hypothetical protein E6929_11755 [Clostridium sp.]|nr:hypothetical protein [Clostridium sp.]
MNNIMVSIFTSLVVSLVTFILGLKAGKNQADRQIVKSKYKEIFKYFKHISNGLSTTNPIDWNKCKSIRINGNTKRYIPKIMEMNNDGELEEINKKMVNILLDLEKKAFNYAYNYSRFLINIQEIIEEKMNLYEYSKPENMDGTTISHIDLGEYLFRENIDEKIKWLNNGSMKGFDFITRDGSHKIIYDNFKIIKISEFVKEVYEEVNKLEESKLLISTREDLIKHIEDVNKSIGKKIKEPFPFWRTFLGAFSDIFKN